MRCACVQVIYSVRGGIEDWAYAGSWGQVGGGCVGEGGVGGGGGGGVRGRCSPPAHSHNAFTEILSVTDSAAGQGRVRPIIRQQVRSPAAPRFAIAGVTRCSYPAARSSYNRDMLRTINFLVETTDDKRWRVTCDVLREAYDV